MHVFEMVLGIVFIVFVSSVLMKYFESKKYRAQNELDEQDLARLADLEERIKVLERIVTDKRYELNREFDDLQSSR